MKKAALGFIAFAMSLIATTANAADSGAIRSIDPCDELGYVIPNGTMAQPYTVGQTAYFRIRLENKNAEDSWATKDGEKLANPWMFEYTGFSPDPYLQWSINPPCVGVIVSGQLRPAKIMPPVAPEGAGWYTDIICSYTVRPGDLALPMTLAGSNGKDLSSANSSEYYLDTFPQKSSSWRLVSYERESRLNWNTVVSTNVCVFALGGFNGTDSYFVGKGGALGAEAASWSRDADLKEAGLYLQSVGFSSSEYSVAEQRTEKITVDIIGGANTNGNGVVYAKVKADSAVSLAEDSVETIEMWDGTATNKYQVAKVTVPSGDDAVSFSFKVKGEKQGDKATVYLSSTKEFTYDDFLTIVTNFVSATVSCTPPPPPYISVTLDGKASLTIPSSTNYTDYAAKLTVTLSEAYTSDVAVEVTPTMISGSGTDPFGKYIAMSTHSENGFMESEKTVTFTKSEMDSGVLSKDLYVYVLGADDDTIGVGNGILFTPAAAGAAGTYFGNAPVKSILYIKKSTPQILFPTEMYSYTGLAGGVESLFTFKISDDYANMQLPFKVQWLKTGSGSPQEFTVVPPYTDNEATVSVRYNAGEYSTRFRIQNAAGVWSDYRTISVQVNQAKQVSAVVENPADVDEFNENDKELSVRFKLTEGFEDSTLYAFLVPMDAASSNLVECKAFTTGVAIRSGDFESTTTTKIKLLDGTEDTLPLTYSIMLRTSKYLNQGEIISTYEAKEFELFINNVAPVIAAVNMSGSAPVTVSGEKFRGKASMGLKKIFTLNIDDVAADRSEPMTAVWTFSDPNGYAASYPVTAPADQIVFTNTFEVAGEYLCSVKLRDKDMGENEYGAEFTFKVDVLDTPSVEIDFPNSNTFSETDADQGKSYFTVKLSTPATKPIDVEIVSSQVGIDGVLKIDTKTVTFRAGQVEQQVLISELDGTANAQSFKGGFLVTASVITDTVNEDGTPWRDVYEPASEKMYVANEPPSIIRPADTGATNDAAINVEIPIPWLIEDVSFDRTNNLTVTWTTSEGMIREFKGDNVFEGVFTNVFTSGGSKEVTMTVTDKDGGISSVKLYYWVSPSKRVNVYPYGPYFGGGLTPISKQYATAAGRGAGRVWGNGGSRTVEDFIHKYTYGFSDTLAELYAWGYRHGQVDDGSLVDSTGKGNRDIAINMSGDSFKLGEDIANCYTYSDKKGRDSFFYAWVIASKEEEATTYTGVPKISPVSPEASGKFSYYALSLPTEQVGDEARPVFADRFVEAYFAKELYAADNMGDMNADRIPDYFATLPWSLSTGESMTIPEALTGQAIAGSTGEEGEAAATASDLANIASYNDDADFLPKAWTSGGNPLKPATRNWGPGEAFTAVYEIRGVGEGLNEPGVSDYDLTPAEKVAMFAAAALDGKPAADYAAATNWAAKAGWTPESLNPNSGSRLNALNGDTDGDGFDDGWEYFFWYYSTAGAVTNGVWGRLEGRRYSPLAPASGVKISSEEIAEAFNPHTARVKGSEFGTDFDNDGLTDLEEYVLGTNPCDWDSDGDGASDLWEVMMGLNPCSELDGSANPDCDFMARCAYAADTFTLYTFENGKVFGLPTATASSVVLSEPASTSKYYKVELASGEIRWSAAKPVLYTVGDVKYLAKTEDAFTVLELDGAQLLGDAISLSAGTAVASVSDAAEEVLPAILPDTGFAWTKPGSQDAATTTEAIEVFNYGGDGLTWVPCSSNATTYAAIPAGVAVVKVQENVTITLLHNQVNVQYGFDPRVAWNINDAGFLDNRWRKPDSDDTGSMGAAGVPTNTVAYTSRDEYLVMQYRMNAQRDLYPALAEFGASAAVAEYSAYTTFPNLPLDFIRAEEFSHNPFTSTNETYLAYWDDLSKSDSVHGADTDNDGVPDGWELYVNYNPNDGLDSVTYEDGDKLSLAQEYAGVDSCNAYAGRITATGKEFPEVVSITKNHPGKVDGWWNKFFPTNPAADDTDGDGLADHLERDSYSGTLPVGRNGYNASFTFIYGDAAGYEENFTSVCFRGGGLNPCSVDTDCDLLPDAWEYEFAGIVFEKGEAKVALSESDKLVLTQADGQQNAVGDGFEIRGGMDGTYSGDANYDFDHDGLMNCQEYLVQSLRHLRYDDALTPLMGVHPKERKFIQFIRFSAWDGNAFWEKCKNSGFQELGAWQFRDLGYFALPPHSWDPIACNTVGLSGCANYAHSEGAGYRVMLRPSVEVPLLGKDKASGYASTDPRCWDTDNDGMDDYYEIFHGLNPLLGSAADPMAINEQGFKNYQTYDVIGRLYKKFTVNAWCNHWTKWSLSSQPAFDAIKYPWMIGTMECDADGDGLRNDEESLKVNVANPQNTHTDPTPLWMTDSTSTKFASFTSQYYDPDPYLSEVPLYNELTTHHDLFCYPWTDMRWNTVVYAPGSGGIDRNWMFSFEENEGFDTDGDFKRDRTELVKGVEPTSDPLNFMDPNRRQALYLPGVDSAAVSIDSEGRRSIGTEPDLLKQFTVECWVRPDEAQRNVVLLERVCVYGASTLSNNQSYVRANFRVGTDADGRVYGMFEGSTKDSGSVRVTGGELEGGVWTHLAFTFDGSTAALYVNGAFAPVDFVNGAGLLPANGIDGIMQESGTSVMPYTGYRALPCANIIGASALTPAAVSVDETTSWDDFSSFYKGWIDEVRIWDGARTPAEIHADYLKRYSFEDVASQRETVYKAWANGGTRASSNSKLALPAELLLHYNFVSIPGGEEQKNVMRMPTGFEAAVLDNVRKTNSKDIDEALNVGWWSSITGVNSTVYRNYAIVPWIKNTVAHLPLMDGSSVDSQYWNSYAAGLIGSFNSGYAYPNSANPYSGYVHRFEKLHHLNRLAVAATLQDYSGEDRHSRYSFQLRSDFVGTSDLVPLGGAFAKRGADFWDNTGAMDAWTTTAASGEKNPDANGNGIPEWAEQLGYTTVEAYIRALAEGLVPSGVKKPEFADTADSNNDGLYDWWQNFHDLKGKAKSDTDKDGLADFAEYLVSDVFKFGEISPVLAKSNGKEFDYFRKAGKLYLGELFADHDFMEDEWENLFANSIVDSAIYDPSADSDGDGWSNYAECRAGTLPDRTSSIVIGADELADYPIPVVRVKAAYSKATSVTAPIVVQAYSGTSAVDAEWVVPGSSIPVDCERAIGINPGKNTVLDLGPGVVVPGSTKVMMRDTQEFDSTGVWQNPSASVWREVLVETVIPGNSDAGNISKVREPVGTIRYPTAQAEIDFSALQGYVYYDVESGVYSFAPPSTNHYMRLDMQNSYVKICWQSMRVPSEASWNFSLSKPAKGHLREGLNTFVAFVDLNGDGEYTVGEPMGVTRNVNVGWSSADVEIAIADNGVRLDLGLAADEMSATRETKVKVYRYQINGTDRATGSSTSGIVNPLILDFNIGNRSSLHDGDFMKGDELDIDWSAFTKDVLESPMVKNYKVNVSSVVYKVEIDSNRLVTSNSFLVTRMFSPYHVKAEPCNTHAVNYSARPVFKWTIPDAAETFTAFSVQVKDASNNVVWNSGFNKMPPKTVSGEYEWTASLYVDDLAAAGRIFSNTNNYTWQVSLHNARYQTNAWSTAQTFRVNVYAADEVNSSGNGVIKASVKYFGPGAFSDDISSMSNIVRVEAYTTPDFTGVPAGRGFVRDCTTLTNASHEANVTIAGLEAGTYYFRAFIDSDGDTKRSAWESWGYVCPRGDIVTGGTFNPVAIKVGAGPAPVEVCYIEDTDVDQDCLPDVYEYDEADAGKIDFLSQKDVADNAHNGYISVNPYMQPAIDNLIGAGANVGLLSLGGGKVSVQVAALALGVPTLENSIEETTLAVKGLALEDGMVKLTLGAEANEPSLGTVFVSDGTVTATIVIKYADSLAGEWNSKEVVKTFEIEAGAVSETIEISLAELGLDASKGFFKVELK